MTRTDLGWCHAMSNNDLKDDSPVAKLHIDKKQGLRHILHSAIRMTLNGEDAFAVNMLAQAADKVLLDLLKRQHERPG